MYVFVHDLNRSKIDYLEQVLGHLDVRYKFVETPLEQITPSEAAKSFLILSSSQELTSVASSNKFMGVILIDNFVESTPESSLIDEIQKKLSENIFLLSTSAEETVFHNLSTFLNLCSSHSGSTGDIFDKVLKNSLQDLEKIKKIHQKVAPLRSEKIKGLEVLTKFAAGLANGGEFFDILKKDSECLVVLSSSRSYVCSSVVLSHFEAFHQNLDFSNDAMEKFVEDIYGDLKSKGMDRDLEDLSLWIGRIDLKNMEIEGHIFGHFFFKSSENSILAGNELTLNPHFVEKSYFSFKLQRGEKVLIFSPGAVLNLKETSGINDLLTYSKNLIKMELSEAIHEIFIEMGNNKSGSFLPHDATILTLEVDQNVIMQV